MDAMTPLFPSAFDVKPPKGAEDWQSLYPYYTLFQPSRRREDDAKFWFCNSQHWPTVCRSPTPRQPKRRGRGRIP